jgi:predicted molibdopterin-dependent oxidoreductase YjgC
MNGPGLRIDDDGARGTRVSFSFDGRQVEAFSAETVAAALWASGIRGWPADESYGPPARTLFCAMGVCQQCAVWIDGVRVEACRTQVRDKLDVRSRP